jgi:hypothetical protein
MLDSRGAPAILSEILGGLPGFSRAASSGLRGTRLCALPGSVRGLLVAALAIAMWGCAGVTTPRGDISGPPGSVASGPPGGDVSAVAQSEQANGGADRGVSGVWQGISVSSCIGEPSDPGRCLAMQRITLTMFQQGAEVTGFYKCAYGTQVCRHLNESGVIHNGTMNHTRLMMRVMHEDGSMCFFTGRPAGDRLDGGYECLQGGGIIEQGTFQTRRTY